MKLHDPNFLIAGKEITNGLKQAFASIRTYPYGVLIVADGTFADGVPDILPSMAVRVVKFSSGGTKLERFLPKNQHEDEH